MPFHPLQYRARHLITAITNRMVAAGYPVQVLGRERYRRDFIPFFYQDWSERAFKRTMRNLLLGAWTSKHARAKVRQVLREILAEEHGESKREVA